MLAFAGGAWILVGVLVLLVVAVVIGHYTRRGNQIPQRPIDSRAGSPGAEGPSRISSAEPEDPRST